MKHRVAEQWVSFEKAILPPNCSDVQRQETRRAFFAGAFAIVDAITLAMSHEDDMTAEDESVLTDLMVERELYLANMLVGRA
jgi:hypothetical protein